MVVVCCQAPAAVVGRYMEASTARCPLQADAVSDTVMIAQIAESTYAAHHVIMHLGQARQCLC